MCPRIARSLGILATAVVALIASFFAGRRLEHFQNGHWYQVRDEQTYHAAPGTVRLLHVTDTHGAPFLDSGDSVIRFEPELGIDVTLYQSKRTFQESRPWVERVQSEGDQLQWSDGMYRYTLHLERIGPAPQPH